MAYCLCSLAKWWPYQRTRAEDDEVVKKVGGLSSGDTLYDSPEVSSFELPVVRAVVRRYVVHLKCAQILHYLHSDPVQERTDDVALTAPCNRRSMTDRNQLETSSSATLLSLRHRT